MGDQQHPLPLRAKQLGAEISDPARPWMFCPAGTHTITLGAGEGAAELTLKIDEATAAVLQASLDKNNAANHPQKSFFDREHDPKGGATAWPKRFFFAAVPAPGIYVESEITALGHQLTAGKVMRAFSPSFYADADLPKSVRAGQMIHVAAGRRGSTANPARITGLVFPDCGTLTNDPAFRKILPLWAKNAAGAPSSTTINPMNKKTPEELAALRAKKTEQEQKVLGLKAQDQTVAANAEALQTAETELQGVTAQIEAEELRARNESLETALLAQRKRDAEDAVKAAVKRGAIAARDEDSQNRWTQKCTEDPENIQLLARMNGSPALTTPRLVLSGVQVAQSDIREELRAYGREPDSLKRGALYARNISPRLKELLDVPLRAADTYAGDLIVQRTLELLKFEFPMLGRVTTDFSAENARYNQEVNTRIVTVPSVVAYHTTNGYVPTATTTTDVPVTINAHKSVPIKFDANVLASTFRQLFEEQLPAMHYAIGKDMVDALYALIVTGTFTGTPTTEAEVDFDRTSVIDMGTALTLAGVPLQGRTLLLAPAYYGALMSDSAIVNLAANQRAEIITGNRLPMIHGFEVIEAANLPTTGNLRGFGFSRSALVIAARVPTDVSNAFPGVSGGAVTRVITNPDTGLSVLMIQHVAPVLGHAYLILAWMYGVAAGQVAAGNILRSSA